MKSEEPRTGAGRARIGHVRCAAFAALLVVIALSATTVTAQAADPITVCIKPDGIMRLLEGAAVCPPGETRKLLAEWAPEETEVPPEEDAGTAAQANTIAAIASRVSALEKNSEQARPDKTEALRVDELSAKIDALTTRVTTLEAGKHRVTAPFEVVGPGGQLILGVGQFAGGQGISIMGSNGAEAVISAVGDTIGLTMEVGNKKTHLSAEKLEMTDGSQKLVASANSLTMADGGDEFNAAAKGLDLTNGDSNFAILTPEKLDVNISGETGTTLDPNGVKLMKGDSSIAEIYKREGKEYAAVRVMKDGQNMAAIGINEFDKGALYVGDGSRTLAAVQGIGDGTGVVDVIGPDGTSAAGLAVGENGRGLIAVRDGSGKAIAALGPSSDSSGGNITLWKGELAVFSAGAASDGGGEACLNRVTSGGQQRLVCLGVGLPGFGGMP